MIKVKKLHPGARLPVRAHYGDAGLDLSACLDRPVVIDPRQVKWVPCGIAIELNPGQVGMVCSRSGLARKHMVRVYNSPGVCDSSFLGEYGILLINESDVPYVINHGDRIAQLVIQKYEPEICEWYDELSDTDRGDGGWGSSGK